MVPVKKNAKPHVYIIKLHTAQKKEYTVIEVRGIALTKLNMHDLSFLYNRILNHTLYRTDVICCKHLADVNAAFIYHIVSKDILYVKIHILNKIIQTLVKKNSLLFMILYISIFFYVSNQIITILLSKQEKWPRPE